MPQRKRKVGADELANLDASQLAALKLACSEREWGQLRKALMDLATGIKVLTRLRKAGYGQDGVERWEIVHETDSGKHEFEGYVYHLPPNPQAIRLLIEQNVGRAPAREPGKVDPNIWIMHMVPGHYGIRPDDATPPPPLDEPEDDPVETPEPEAATPEPPPVPDLTPDEPSLPGDIGIHAVMEPDWRDEPVEG